MRLTNSSSGRLRGVSTRRTLAGALGLLLALGLIVGLAGPVLAIPQIPHQFWGDVTISGNPAPLGTEVRADINGVTYATQAVDAAGKYGWSAVFRVPADDPDTGPIEGGQNGDTINFFVGGVAAGNAIFQIGGRTELNLAIGQPPQQYTLTMAVSGNGTTNPAVGPHIYAAGTVVNISAIPANCWQFVNWTGDVANAGSQNTTVTMNADKTVTANFTQINYTLTMAVTGNGSTTPAVGPHIYPCGTVVDISATPAGGWQFVNWTGDVANAALQNTTVTMNADKTVTANFSQQPPQQFQLTVGTTGGGTVTNPGLGIFTYNAGTVVNIAASANPGFSFTSWTGDVGTVANVNNANTTITMNGNYSIMANFSQQPQPQQFQLTVSSTDGGFVTLPGEGVFTYNAGTVVNIVGVPEPHYQFLNWTGDVGTVANVNAVSTTITMNGNYSIVANFVPIQHTLTVNTTAGGSVTAPGTGTYTYIEGTVVNLVAAAQPCFQFVNWSGDVGTVANVNSANTTITMNGDYTITANFAHSGVAMTIALRQGWNTFSTPIVLDTCTDTWGELQAQNNLNILIAYTYNPLTYSWAQVLNSDMVIVQEGYYVKLGSAGSVEIIPSSEPTFPPSKQLSAGLNLIGLASLNNMNVASALVSIYEVPGGLTGYSQVISPALNTPGDWIYIRDALNPPDMEAGKAYWVIMVNPGTLFGFTSTPIP